MGSPPVASPSHRKKRFLTLWPCQCHSLPASQRRVTNGDGLNETGIASIIYAIQLCDVINLSSEQSVLQPTCNNICARMPAIAFVLTEWHDDIGGFWGNRVFGDEPEE